MTTKMTIKDYFNEAIEVAAAADRPDLVEFFEGRIAVLDKKSGSRKPTAKQTENENFKSEILTTLTTDGITVSDLQSKSEALSGISNQRISALLSQLVKAGKVVKTYDKKKAYFALAE